MEDLPAQMPSLYKHVLELSQVLHCDYTSTQPNKHFDDSKARTALTSSGDFSYRRRKMQVNCADVAVLSTRRARGRVSSLALLLPRLHEVSGGSQGSLTMTGA